MAKSKQYWLLKSEPDCYSFDDLKRDGQTAWTGVRNYQARNFLRDSMQPGDQAFFYHSSADPAAIVGICEIVGPPIPDETAWDKDDDHFDPKSSPENPIWCARMVKYLKPLAKPLTIGEARSIPELATMVLLQKGSRLSVQPVKPEEWEIIVRRK